MRGSVAVLLGAGASVEAGVPTAREFTDLLMNFSTHFPDDDSPAVENLVRHVQLRIAIAQGRPASSIDFEIVLGALADISTGKLPATFSLFSADASFPGGSEASKLLRDRTRRMFDLLRQLLVTSSERTDYLRSLLALRLPRQPLELFTLNFDTTIEAMLVRSRKKFVDGFSPLKTPVGWRRWDPAQFDRASVTARVYKLHGSVDWAFPYPWSGRISDSKSIDLQPEDYLNAYPWMVSIPDWADLPFEIPGSSAGVVPAMNFGTRKELLYTETPFAELFVRFRRCLTEVSVLVIAGYSFRDERVNRVVEEAVVARTGALRVVVVDPAVFQVADALPTLWAFMRAGVAKFLEQPLGRCLEGGILLGAVREMQALAGAGPQALNWGNRVIAIPTPVSTARNVEEIHRLWRELRAAIDGAVVVHGRVRGLMLEAASAVSIEPELIAANLRALIPIARRQMVALDHVMEAMNFGPYFGPSAVAGVRLFPPLTGIAGTPQAIEQCLAEVARWIDVAFRSYHFATEEFLNAVSDSEYGVRVGAPDNFSMAEMVSRDVRDKVGEIAYALNAAFEALGYERPLP